MNIGLFITSKTCSFVPAPPDAIVGTFTDLETFEISLISKPFEDRHYLLRL